MVSCKMGIEKKTMIKNTNIRLDLLKPEDRKAWEYLQIMDCKRYKSYSKAIVIAVNDFFSRQEQLEKDPYLETRAKEDAFLERILKTVREGAKEAMPETALGCGLCASWKYGRVRIQKCRSWIDLLKIYL